MAASAVHAAADEAAHASDRPARSTPALRVLLLEDNGFDAELIGEALCRHRACDIERVRSRADYEAALGRGHDIILSDFSVPGFSGLEALGLAAERCPLVPFIIISGVLGEEHAVEMLKRGATDYVVKDRLDRLSFAVDRALAESNERHQRQQAERALRDSQDQFRRVIESLRDYAVVLLAPDARVTACNRAAGEVFGVDSERLAGQPASAVLRFADADRGVLDGLLEKAHALGAVDDARWLMRGDGERFFASIVLTAIPDGADGASGYSLIVRDTTEQRAAAEALQAAKTAAERANQAKDRFIAVLSHELRTPLVPILAGAQLLERFDGLTPKMADVVTRIRRNALLEARLIDDMLDATSIERGKLTIECTPVDAHVALQAALETITGDARDKRLQLDVELAAEESRVLGDEARLQQVFWNLLRNAVKFTPTGGRISVRTRNDDDGQLCICVRDTGSGIGAEAMQHIFSPFEQSAAARNAGRGGLGLGLAIARGLARAHGGSIEARSDGVDRGAEFIVRLPCTPAELGEATPEPVAWSPQRSGLHVLLVEDNIDSEIMLKCALEAHGHEVSTARTATEARARVHAESFDVVICDIGLPDGSGLDVMAAIGGRFPAIALSGFGMEENRRASLAAGFDQHLIKPIAAEQLNEAVLAAIGRRLSRRRTA